MRCSRPTAVNLQDASRKLERLLRDATAGDATGASVVTAVIGFAERMMEEDVAANRAIGKHGADAILAAAVAAGRGGDGGRVRVLTHCNTGSLATVQFGTALGCIRALHERGVLERAYCTETRQVPGRALAIPPLACSPFERRTHPTWSLRLL